MKQKNPTLRISGTLIFAVLITTFLVAIVTGKMENQRVPECALVRRMG